MILDKENCLKEIIRLNNEHAKVYDNIFAISFYKEHLFDVKEKIKDEKGITCVDVGCGTGNLLLLLNECYTIGIDFSKEMLYQAKKKLSKRMNCDLIRAEISHLPLKDSSVDIISNVNVFYQLQAPEEFLKEANRILKVKGSLITSTPYEKSTFIGFVKSFVCSPRNLMSFPHLIYKLPKLLYGQYINRKIFRYSKLYSFHKLTSMIENYFRIISIQKTYGNQNLLIVSEKMRSPTF